MKAISKILSLTLMALIIIVGFSCKKDNEAPNPANGSEDNGTDGSNSLIVSADLNFVDLGKDFDFKCYEKKAEVDYISIKDDTLKMNFANNETIKGDTIVLQLIVSGVSDLNAGDTYSVSGNSGSLVSLSIYTDNEPAPYGASNMAGSPHTNSGELKITSTIGNHIKGSFHFKGYTFSNSQEPSAQQKEVIVSNGKIDCDYTIK